MKLTPKPFQEDAIEATVKRLRTATTNAGPADLHAVLLSAATGAGKTVIATKVLELLMEGDDDQSPNPNATFLWITDLPEVNEQTMEKMRANSEVLNPLRAVPIKTEDVHRTLIPGRLYFLNTQKLGQDKRLTNPGEKRPYSIWQTIDNTIDELGGNFHVVLDEAHRGMRNGGSHKDAASIVQKFIKGSPEMRPAPVVFGISATPQPFLDLLGTTNRTVSQYNVPVEDVRASGLLKDRIILHHGDDTQKDHFALLKEATRHCQMYAAKWADYAERTGGEPIQPILVVQTQDRVSDRDLATAIRAITESVAEELPSAAFAHSFDTGADHHIDGRVLRYLAPSRIDSDHDVRVIFFKTALSTGWDCPRAEVMMSFRGVRGAIFIAQLIGRMVRTPLAERIESDPTLNDVSLFLPNYDRKALDDVIKRLSDPDHEYVPPTEAVLADDTVDLERADDTAAIFEALRNTPTAIIPRTRPTRQVRRLLKLARALSDDGIEEKAIAKARSGLVSHLKRQLETKESEKAFQDAVEGRASISYGTTVYDFGSQHTEESGARHLITSEEKVGRLYEASGRKVGDGLHIDLLGALTAKTSSPEDMRQAKIKIGVLLSDPTVQESVETYAEKTVSSKRSKYHADIEALGEDRRGPYRQVAAMAPRPEYATLAMPVRVPWKSWQSDENAEPIPKHVYTDERGEFRIMLGSSWERHILKSLLGEAVGWLRVVPRKDWALCIPYLVHGQYRPLYPDLLVFRSEDGRAIVDLIDPHDPGRDEAAPKAAGLALFAKEQGHMFGRIWLVAKVEGSYRILDLQEPKTRQAVEKVGSSSELKNLYSTLGDAYAE